MVKSVKYLVFFVACLFFSNTLFGMNLTCVQPTGMQRTGLVAISQSGLVNYTVKANTKNVETNRPEVEASVIDLSDSMKSSQRNIFVAYGLIPMAVIVKNNSDQVIHVASGVLDYGIGLSLANVKDAIIKNFKFKKYGIYASIAAYRVIILASLITAGVYFPYSDTYLLTKDLLASVHSGPFYDITTSGFSLINEIPASVKFGSGIISLCLALKYLTPSIFVRPFHAFIDNYYRMRSTYSAPFASINELNKAIDFVVNSSNNRDLDVNPKLSKQFVIFVRSTDATGIKNGTTFPVLKFE
ncbi:MAG: hypothetical protein V1646_01185 [bacterium]